MKAGSNIFRFKRFSVSNSRSGLKVGTDGVLLGAATDVDFLTSNETSLPAGEDIRVLDIGTGTGLIALMLAQRLSDGLKESDVKCGRSFHITGIDIDGDAAQEAVENFAASPWAENLAGRHCSLESFGQELSSGGYPERYDLIVSNPPYYDNSLKAPDPQRNTVRHTDSLSYRDVIRFSTGYLTQEGRLALVLPKEDETTLKRYAVSFGLYPYRMTEIKTTPAKPPRRIVAEFSRMKTIPITRTLTIQTAPGILTEEFQALTDEFYL